MYSADFKRRSGGLADDQNECDPEPLPFERLSHGYQRQHAGTLESRSRNPGSGFGGHGKPRDEEIVRLNRGLAHLRGTLQGFNLSNEKRYSGLKEAAAFFAKESR